MTGVIYGIRKTDDAFARELVTIDPLTGDTTLVGSMGMHITSMAFVGCPLHILSITCNGNDLTITWTGGIPPYQLQTRSKPEPGLPLGQCRRHHHPTLRHHHQW